MYICAVEISVVIPVYNEEGNLRALHERLSMVLSSLTADFEMVFVNDGSTDSSIEIIRELTKDKKVKYLDFSKNFGHQIAAFAGLEHAEGNAVVIIDADLQDPPELILELYQKMQEGYDVVYAKRQVRDGETWHKKLTAKWFYRLINNLSEVEIPLDTGDFRIMSSRIKNIIISLPERNKFLRGQIAWTGFNQTYVLYNRAERMQGKSNYTYSKMFRFAFDGITSFSNFPLRLATYLGFIVSLVAFVVIVYTLYQKYFGIDTVPGWSSTMVSILFLGGVQLICLGIIGEYLGRIMDNVKQRPLYLIKETNI